jgi:CheY-like chemotaxis protein
MSKGKNDSLLRGLRVLIVEDEIAILLLVEELLASLGCKVAATACHIAPAFATARDGAFDAAVLDINIAGETVYPVAEALVARNVPIVFSTGYGVQGVEAAWRDWPILQKPYRAEQLADALKSAIRRATELRQMSSKE